MVHTQAPIEYILYWLPVWDIGASRRDPLCHHVIDALLVVPASCHGSLEYREKRRMVRPNVEMPPEAMVACKTGTMIFIEYVIRI